MQVNKLHGKFSGFFPEGVTEEQVVKSIQSALDSLGAKPCDLSVESSDDNPPPQPPPK